MPPPKKNRLTPTKYDEVSLVDFGAAEDAMVLIMKRAAPDSAPAKKKSGETQRAQNWQDSRHPRAKPGSAAPNSGGTFTKTSSASKSKFGKGGTTAANQDAKSILLADMNVHVKAARASIKANGGDKKTGGGGGKSAASKTKAIASKALALKKRLAAKKLAADKKAAALAKKIAVQRLRAAQKALGTHQAIPSIRRVTPIGGRIVASQKHSPVSTAQSNLVMSSTGIIKSNLLSKWIEGK